MATKLRTLASVLASSLCAAGLTVGGALAQPAHATTLHGKAAKPAGLCFLHDLTR